MGVIKQIFILIFMITNSIASDHKSESCTDLAREEEQLLVFSTLRGGLIALDLLTGSFRWAVEDEPAVKIPTSEDQIETPQFLPDPRDGSLYSWGTAGSGSGPLQKLPFTIPQLVASAPCRSSDGILYSGRKSDTWYLLDIKTGKRKEVLGFNDGVSVPPIGSSHHTVFLGRSQYTVLMYNSANKRAWNVTFVGYTARSMPKDVSNEYEFLHFVGSGSGRTATLDRSTGALLWEQDVGSPVVAAYLLGRDGLLAAPFSTLSDDTLNNIVSYSKDGFGRNLKLYETLYVGEHRHGLYALSSLVDKNTVTIGDPKQTLLIEGPNQEGSIINQNYNHNYNLAYMKQFENENPYYIILGHYRVPKVSDTHLQIGRSTELVSVGPSNIAVPVKQEVVIVTESNDSAFQINYTKEGNEPSLDTKSVQLENNKVSVGIQTDDESKVEKNNSQNHKYIFKEGGTLLKKMVNQTRHWFHTQENKGLKLILIVLVGLVITMFWYVQHQAREFQQLSNSGSRGKVLNQAGLVTGLPEDLGEGVVKVGKVIFDTKELLGKGCDGTFVFKGVFESRDVAVKRLLPECFTLAEREVSLLRESDAHANVVRYYCTEQDRQFKYIALELCAATLLQYVEGTLDFKCDTDQLELLRQATEGLSHLHSLNIVHRDIKPHNVLLSLPGPGGSVRAMISDFGLCKKLMSGRHSFSRTSGVAGTDGWIAPEIMSDDRTTTAVDIFSLGCVFYYVLSKGNHPFGGPLHRQANILSGRSSFTALQDLPLAKNLVSTMVISKSSERPSANAVKKHPMFWNETMCLAFLQDMSDRVERELDTSDPVIAMEREAHQIVQDDWRRLLDPTISEDLRRYRTYNGGNVRDLLRALRNKKHHYHELPPQAQDALGALPGPFTRYWLDRFPLLLVHVWGGLQFLKHEAALNTYYPEDYTFPLWDNGKICCEIISADIKLRTNMESHTNNSDSQIKIVYKQKDNLENRMWVQNEDAPRDFKNFKFKNKRADNSRYSPPRLKYNSNHDKVRNSNSYDQNIADFSKSDANKSNYDDNLNKARVRFSKSVVKKEKNKKDEVPLMWTIPPSDRKQ